MKVLVIGASGQVGRNLVSQLSARGDEPVCTYNSRAPIGSDHPAERLDKTDPAMGKRVIERYRPAVVVDTGALHNVDYCETHRDEAFLVNSTGTRLLAEAAQSVGARFVFVSTDFVFDGRKTVPYIESDPTNPESAYAESKVDGERATLMVSDNNIVVRPSVIYSWVDSRQRSESSSGKGVNFGTWLAQEVAAGRPVRIIQDQIASPTLAEDLAGAILALLDRGAQGIFHAAGSTPVDRYHFSVRLVERLGLEPGLVHATVTSELNQRAKRPANSSLSSELLGRSTGYRMLDLESALERFANSVRADLEPLGG